MSKRLFSQKQVSILLKNSNVDKCSPKSVTYSKNFKIRAVKQHQDSYLTAAQIFETAGFDAAIMGPDSAKNLLKAWRKIYKVKGSKGLEIDGRGRSPGGGRPRTKALSEADKIIILEAQVAYLKAENDFLAKLRAGKAE